jgi:hypothetical protein
MRKILAILLALLIAAPAYATVTIIQKQVAVPTTAPTGYSLTPFDYCNDGTNTFSCLSDGTNIVGVDPTSKGLFADIVACAVGVCGLPTVTSNALVKGAITTPMTTTGATTLIAAVTSQRLYVTSVSCQNTSATIGTLVQITDGSGGAVLATLAAGETFGGDNRNGGSAPLFWTTAGNGLFAQDVTTSASVTCNASGYSSAN